MRLRPKLRASCCACDVPRGALMWPAWAPVAGVCESSSALHGKHAPSCTHRTLQSRDDPTAGAGRQPGAFDHQWCGRRGEGQGALSSMQASGAVCGRPRRAAIGGLAAGDPRSPEPHANAVRATDHAACCARRHLPTPTAHLVLPPCHVQVLDTGGTNLADLNSPNGVSFVGGSLNNQWQDKQNHGTHVRVGRSSGQRRGGACEAPGALLRGT